MEDSEDQPTNQNLSAATNVTSDHDRVRLVTVLAPTEEFLKGAFKTLTNPEKKQLRNQFTVPDLPLSLTQRLDKVWEAECSKDVKFFDQQLTRGQAFFPGSLMETIDTINTGQQLSINDVEEHVKAALFPLGNVSSQLSTLRQLKVVEEYDKDLSFKDYQAEAPNLFGAEFQGKALLHLTQVRELKNAKTLKSQGYSKASP